jgi:hypothetical protein
MSGNDVPRRIKSLLAAGNLTVSDIARWLGRPIPTISGWAKGGRVGTLPPHDLAHLAAQLRELERRIERRAGLPVPPMSMRKRKEYMAKLMEAK